MPTKKPAHPKGGKTAKKPARAAGKAKPAKKVSAKKTIAKPSHPVGKSMPARKKPDAKKAIGQKKADAGKHKVIAKKHGH